MVIYRRILLECFVLMCSLDRPVISLLLSSVLPLEVAQVKAPPLLCPTSEGGPGNPCGLGLVAQSAM